MVLVLGKGKSGTSAARLLEGMGFSVHVYDDSDATVQGGRFEFAVKSPGFPPSHFLVKRLLEEGVEVVGEVEIAFRYAKGRVAAITGTNGKSTVTAMVYHALSTGFSDVFIGGNFGIPFSDFCTDTTENSVSVLELSSYQIEDLSTFMSDVSAVLNVTPDHLNRYGSFEDYAGAKLKLLEHTKGVAVLNLDDPVLSGVDFKGARWFSMNREADAFFDGNLIRAGSFSIDVRELPLKGYHNVQNYMASLLILNSLGMDFEASAEALLSFNGLEHRMEEVAVVDGVRFINDSKSTNVDSLRKALMSVESAVLIAGGKDKKLDFSPLREVVRGRVKAIVAIGETRGEFSRVFSDIVEVFEVDSLEDSVLKAFSLSSRGDTVLFSPGCSSFDMFSSFEERGRRFKEIVKGLRRSVEA